MALAEADRLRVLQHGVGVDHKAYLMAEKGPLGIAAIRNLSEMFDPPGLMNPGKLLPDAE